jgi:uncharacterized protein involved in exopolysaccharide biosynthesis
VINLNYHQILNTILFNRNIIIKITVLSVIFIFLILFFVYPLSYESPVTVLPPEKNSQIGGLGSLLGGGDLTNIITEGMGQANSQLFQEILKSRSAAEYVVKKNNLIAFYNVDDMEGAVKKLRNNLNTEITKEGIIQLSVKVSTSFFPFFSNEKEFVKKLSADVSNSYIEALDVINREKLTSKAKKAREYIESQITITKADLDSVEASLMNFQKSNKTISLPEQVKAAIESAAKLKSEIVTNEVELGVAQINLKDDNSTLTALKSKLEQLKEQYNKLEMGNNDYLMSFGEAPEIGRKLASLVREAKIQNEVYLMLQQQYYKEKIQENRDTPTIEVLDKAITPKKASGPRVLYSSALGGIFVFLLVSMIIIYSEQKKLKP